MNTLMQLHFLLFVPTVAFWIFYGAYWLNAAESRWQEEIKVVPWHHDLPHRLEELRHQIPEHTSVLLILEKPGTISYAPFFNTHLYPRKVYVHRRDPNQGRVTRDDVNMNDLRQQGIEWVITYSGPREFDATQLKIEDLSK
jgi:hypothetical protein